MQSNKFAGRAVKRFAEYKDLDLHRCTIQECEEYEPYLDQGIVLYTGVDYAATLEEAEADIIIWDGGSDDLPFFVSDFHVVMADLHRAGTELNSHLAESNLRIADLVIINKVDTANYADVARVRENIQTVNTEALILEAVAPLFVTHSQAIKGKRVLVIEDIISGYRHTDRDRLTDRQIWPSNSAINPHLITTCYT